MIGIVSFEHLKISCCIGVEDFERQHPQDIFIDLKVKCDFSSCSQTNNLKDTIDYTILSNICQKICQSKDYHLMEILAVDIIEAIMKIEDAQWAWIKIKKPQAIPNASFAYVELERGR